MKVLTDFRNELLKRRELKVVVDADSNPGFSNSKKIISEKFKANEENMEVKAVKSKFGRKTFLIDAYIYDSTSDKDRIEPKKKVKKAKEGAA